MHIDVDGWNVADIQTNDVRLLDADGQAKFFTGISKSVYQSLKALCGVGRKCSGLLRTFALRRARLNSLPYDLVWM